MSRLSPRILWVFSDSKPGHENQSMGLIDALAEVLSIQHYLLPPLSNREAMVRLIAGQMHSDWQLLPSPDAIIGAGQTTHLSIVLAKRAFPASKTIVLMRPWLPMQFFDLCLVPEHDNPRPHDKILVTRGPLNRIKPTRRHQSCGQGLFLIGGPCKHYEWQNKLVVDQVLRIVDHDRNVNWTLTTSRRTPAEFLRLIEPFAGKNLALVPAAQTPRGWVAEQLSRCSTAWVSEDSASMVYEALTAGAAVGVLSVEHHSSSRTNRLAGRVERGLRQLSAQGIVTCFAEWESGKQPVATATPISEARRCARAIAEKWWLPRGNGDLHAQSAGAIELMPDGTRPTFANHEASVR